MTAINAQRWKPATDLLKERFEDEIISLPELYFAAARRGVGEVRGRRFVNCRLTGPAVMLVLDGLDFDGCHLGKVDGDIRKLLLKPLSETEVTGAIAFRRCAFEACVFEGVGFTGNQNFLDSFLQIR